MSASAVSKLALSLVGASLLLAPPPAAADRDWDDDDDRRGHYGRSHRHDDHHHKHRKHWNDHGRHHRHGDWCPPQHARPYVHRRPAYYYDYDDGPRYYRPPVRRVRYYCDPCDHWYGTEASFHYHVHHSHGVARALVPAVIAAAAFGYVFAGY